MLIEWLKNKVYIGMNICDYFNIFVGSEKNPTFLVELNKNNVTVYKPDKYSKNEDPYEKYILGEIILETSFYSVIYKELKKYNIPGYSIKAYITPEIIIRIKDKYISISNKLTYNYKFKDKTMKKKKTMKKTMKKKKTKKTI